MLTDIASGIRTRLLAVSAISIAVGTRVYYKRAGEGAAMPYIVIAEVAGGRANETPREAFDMFWQTDVVAAGGDQALTIAANIVAALHLTQLDFGSTWDYLDVQHEEPVYWIEDVERRQYHHAVDTFRVRGTE